MGWFVLGSGAGLTQYILQANMDAPFAAKLIQAGITALICGFLGMAGKWLFDYIKGKLTKSK